MSWVESPFRALASKSDSTMPQLVFYAKIDDHGIRRGDTGQKLPDGGVQWHLG